MWPLAAALVVGAWLFRRRAFARERVALLLGLWALFAIAQCTVRAVRDGSLDERQFVPVLLLVGAWAFWRAWRMDGVPALFWLGCLPGLAAYLFILRSTVLGLPATFLYLTWPAFCGLLVLLRRQPRMGRALLAGMLVFLAVCRVLAALHGWKYHSAVAAALFFSGSFHKFDMDGSHPENSWLTCDEEIVRRYYGEPRCTFPFTVSGYYTITRLLKTIQNPAEIAKTPRDLPILFVAGAQDPVGAFGAGVRKVARMYRDAGHENQKLVLYPKARHEVLNEVDRADYWQDILAWCRDLV